MSTSTQNTVRLPANLPPGAMLRALRGGAVPAGAVLRPIGAKIAPGAVQEPGQGPKQGRDPIGTREPATGRTVLQQPQRPEVSQAAATAEHPAVRATLEKVVKGIPGAKLAGARPEKDEDRLEEKIEAEGQSPRTVRDYSGFRIAADTTPAKDAVVSALRQHFDVPDEQDEWEKGSPETGFHGHTLQVREVTPAPKDRAAGSPPDAASPVTHEVQVLPREVAEHADGRHHLYEKARDGDAGAAAQLKGANEKDWRDFQSRQAPAPPAVGPSAATPPHAAPAKGAEPDGEKKYNFGNTQANIPEGSEAAKSLNALRDRIPADHLAGNGKDVGAGGNHVTLRYGIKGDDTSGIEKYLSSQPPTTARMGKTEVFPPCVYSDGAAVLVVRVESPELERMNGEIGKHGDFAPPSFKTYKPHATIAYIDPEKAKLYGDSSELEGKTFPVQSVSITDRDGGSRNIPLAPASAAAAPKKPEGTAGDRFKQMADGRKGSTASKGAAKQSAAPQGSQVPKKGSVVTLKDGSAGVVKYVSPAVNGGQARARVRTASGETRLSVKPEDMQTVTPIAPKQDTEWYGFDLDKTLAVDHGFQGDEVIGPQVYD